MPRIHTITTDTVITDNDMILGTDGAVGANNATKNFSFGVFKNYLWTSPTITGNLTVSGGEIILDNNRYLQGKLTNGTAIDLIGVKSNNIVTISDDSQETHIGPVSGNTNFQVNGAFVLTGAAVLNGDVQIGGDLTVDGTITLGDANTDNIVFGAEVDSDIIPDDDVAYSLGSSSKKWDTLFANRVELTNHATVGGNLTVNGATALNGYVTLGDAGSDIISVVGITAFNAPVNVGDDGDGHVVKLYSDTSSRYLSFDPTGNGSLIFTDTTMAKFGNSSDLQIYHNGTSNYIDSNGGQMYLRASVSDGKMFFMGDDGNGGYAEYFYLDGAAAVYDNNQGQHVSVETRFPVDSKATFGITGGMQTSLWSSNAGNFFMSETGGGNMYFQTDGTEIVFSKRGSGATHQNPLNGAETMAKFVIDGAVELYHDNAKKLETTSTGITVTGSIVGALNTTGGTLHDPTFTGTVTSNANLIVLAGQDTAAQVELKADAGDNNDDHWKLSAEPNATFKILTRDGGTYSSAVDFVASNKNAYFKGDISVLDNKKLLVGGGSDLQIFHDGSDSYVSDTGDGNLYLKGGNQVRIVGDAANSDEIWAIFGSDAAELWFDGNKKLETTATGIKTTGTVSVNNAYTLPTSDGTNGQILQTNGSGALSFADATASVPFIDGGTDFTDGLIIGHNTHVGTLDAAERNVGVGNTVLEDLTSGDDNTVLGHAAGKGLTSGSDNVLIGAAAGYNIETATDVIAIGARAIGGSNGNSTGQQVVAIGNDTVRMGYQSGSNNIAGTTAIGHTAGERNQGFGSTFIGWNAGSTVEGYDSGGSYHDEELHSNAAHRCVIIGGNAGTSSTSVTNEIVLGFGAKGKGSNTVVIGNNATLQWLPHDNNGVDLGSGTLSFKNAFIQGVLNIGDVSGSTYFQLPSTIGTAGQVLKVPSSGNSLTWADDATGLLGIQQGGNFTNSLIIGHDGTGSLDNALGNTGVGVGAINAITSGDHNVAFGHDALGALTEGLSNVAIGKQALFTLTTSDNNVAVGKDALYNNTANNNTAVGMNAGVNITTGQDNVIMGYLAGQAMTSGYENVVIGKDAAKSMSGSNSTTFKNVIIGTEAYDSRTSGTNNVVIGHGAVGSGGTGGIGNNVVVGGTAGTKMTVGSNSNTVIGYGADISANGSDNEIVIGKDADGLGANKAVIGSSSITNIAPGADGTVSLGDDSRGFEELILTSPNGTKYRVKVDNSGNLSATAV